MHDRGGPSNKTGVKRFRSAPLSPVSSVVPRRTAGGSLSDIYVRCTGLLRVANVSSKLLSDAGSVEAAIENVGRSCLMLPIIAL